MHNEFLEIEVAVEGHRRHGTVVITEIGSKPEARYKYSLVYRGQQFDCEREFGAGEIAAIRISAQKMLQRLVSQELYRALTHELVKRLAPAAGRVAQS